MPVGREVQVVLVAWWVDVRSSSGRMTLREKGITFVSDHRQQRASRIPLT
jgi:hypothetical protein